MRKNFYKIRVNVSIELIAFVGLHYSAKIDPDKIAYANFYNLCFQSLVKIVINGAMDFDRSEQLGTQIDHALKGDTVSDSGDFPEIQKGFLLADRYRLDSKLGEGGMGIVLGGYDEQLQRKIAVKLVKPSLSNDKASVEMLRQEAKVSMMLTHPGIMRLINFEQDGKYTFLLMEYVEGSNLLVFRKTRQEGKLKGIEVAGIGYKMCAALEYAHNKNVIHRDIKPANIMIDPGLSHLKLMDFGIARTLVYESDERPKIAGTLAFIAPEIFAGALPDKRIDIYALGLTLYELAAGRHPFHGKSASEIIDHHNNTVPGPLDGVDSRLSKIIFQCIEKKPNARFQTAKYLAGALARYLDLDDRAKMSRMKGAVDMEKRDVARKIRELDKKKMELEREKRKFKETNTERGGILAIDTPINRGWTEVIKDQTKVESGTMLLTGGAALTGLFAAFAGAMIADGKIMYFEYAESYSMFSSIAICLIVISVPAWLKFGRWMGAGGAAVGAVMGYLGFLASEAYTLYSIEHETTIPFDLIAFLTLSIPIGVGVAIIHIDKERISRTLTLAAITIALAIVSTLLPIIHFAQGVFGLEEENVNYVYIPLLTLFMWGGVELWERWKEG